MARCGLKVCLINPPYKYLRNPTKRVPLGILYIAGVLKQNKIPFTLLDLNMVNEKTFPKADLYGITGTVLDSSACNFIAREIKNQQPEAKIVIGGPITFTKKYIDKENIDAILVGEGEEGIISILEDFPKLKAVYVANRIDNLNDIPFPLKTVINRKYFETSIPIITSRGCAFDCAFCAAKHIWKKKVKFRSIDNILEEIDLEQVSFKHSVFDFVDDNITATKKRIVSLCSQLKNMKILWKACIRAKPNSLDMFKLMYEAGCREVGIGVESGDQYILDFLNKQTTIEDNRFCIENAKKAGISTRLFFMINTPGETKSTVDKNIAFLDSLTYDILSLMVFVPMPGSSIFNNPKEFDCSIINDHPDFYNMSLLFNTGMNENITIDMDQLSKKDMLENRKRMFDYAINSGRLNLS